MTGGFDHLVEAKRLVGAHQPPEAPLPMDMIDSEMLEAQAHALIALVDRMDDIAESLGVLSGRRVGLSPLFDINESLINLNQNITPR